MATKSGWREFLDLDTSRGRRANHVLTVLIVTSVVTLIMDVHHRANGGVPGWLIAAETAIWLLFCVEYVLRIVVAPNKKAYILSFYGIIDLLALVGGLSSIPPLASLRVLRVLRVFRVVKLVRGSAALDRFRTAFRDIVDELAVYLSASGILMFIASVGIYELEHDQEGTLYTGVFDSFYWAVLSLTAGAEGYQPQSTGGKLLSIAVVLIGLGVVAVPSGLLASALYKTDSDGAGQSDSHVPDVG